MNLKNWTRSINMKCLSLLVGKYKIYDAFPVNLVDKILYNIHDGWKIIKYQAHFDQNINKQTFMQESSEKMFGGFFVL